MSKRTLTQGYTTVWDADTTYQQGMVVVSSGALWEATRNNVLNSLPTPINPDWLLVLLGGGAPPSGGIDIWSSLVTYHLGDLVIDREGTWRATGTSLNSQPGIGSTDWTLVGGTPFITAHLSATDINNAGSSPPLLSLAPLATQAAIPLWFFCTLNAGTITWDFDQNVFGDLGWETGTDPAGAFIFKAKGFVNSTAMVMEGYTSGVPLTGIKGKRWRVNNAADHLGTAGIDVSALTVNAAGSGYNVADVISISGGGSGDAIFYVGTIGVGGSVLTLVGPKPVIPPPPNIPSAEAGTSGTGYSVATGVATTALSGTGDNALTVDIGAVGDGNGSLDLTIYYTLVTIP